jgi:hypothetical protein
VVLVGSDVDCWEVGPVGGPWVIGMYPLRGLWSSGPSFSFASWSRGEQFVPLPRSLPLPSAMLSRSPKQHISFILDWILYDHEPKQPFSLYKLIVSGILLWWHEADQHMSVCCNGNFVVFTSYIFILSLFQAWEFIKVATTKEWKHKLSPYFPKFNVVSILIVVPSMFYDHYLKIKLLLPRY